MADKRCLLYAKPRAILFDWDKTLVDNWSAILHALNEALFAMGQPILSEEDARLRVRQSARESFPKIFGADADKALDIFYESFSKKHCSELKPLSGVQNMLDILAGTGIKMGVVSNKASDYLQREVTHLGWNKYFITIIGAGDASADKPDPAPIFLALEQGKIGPVGGDIWYVGDNEMDMQCANSAGICPVLVNTLDLPKSHFQAANAMPALTFQDSHAILEYAQKHWIEKRSSN